MRPQDIAILLKLVAIGDIEWRQQVLANTLYVSASEISESLNRSRIARLIDHDKKRVNRQSLFEFLKFGVRYVFPQEPGGMSRGMVTGISHPFMKDFFASEYTYVWPDLKGEYIGLTIEPLYDNQPKAAREDSLFYKLLALLDVVRVGKVREVDVALNELKNIVLSEPSNQPIQN